MGSAIKRNIRIYLKYIAVVLRGAMSYKTSFFLMIVGRFVLAFNGFIAIYFLFSGFSNVKGYSYGDILLCFAVMQLSFAVAECISTGFKTISGIIKEGKFDRILLRPVSPVLQVLGSRFEIGRVGPMISAVIVLAIGIRESGIAWQPDKMFTLVMMILGGILLFSALFMLGAVICFFSIEDGGIMNILTYGARDHGKYPFDIYGKGIMRVCTYIVPYTLVQYYPLQYLLGKSNHVIYAFYPLGSLVFVVVAYLFWRMGVKNYKSSGS